MNKLYEQLTIEDFDPHHFIDTQTLKSQGSLKSSKDSFASIALGKNTKELDPDILIACFEQVILNLDELQQKLEMDEDKLMLAAKNEEEIIKNEVSDLCADLDTARDEMDGLEYKIQVVSHKVGHLVDQLESANVPRERVMEMEKLVRHLFQFYQDPNAKLDVKSNLAENSQIIQQLHNICLEFSDDADHMLATKQRVFTQYGDIDSFLYREFESAFRKNSYDECITLSTILVQFKSYQKCVDLFVNERLKQLPFDDKMVFKELFPVTESTQSLCKKVFINSDLVMMSFMNMVYNKRLKEMVGKMLKEAEKQDRRKFLDTLEFLYLENQKVCVALSKLHIGADMQRLNKSLFGPWVTMYFGVELSYLDERCSTVLDHYYEEQGHTRRRELLEEKAQGFNAQGKLQHFLSTISSEENAPSPVLLCGLTTANLVEEIKQSCKRLQHISPVSELSGNASKVAETFLRYIFHEHILYGLKISALGITTVPEPVANPELSFLEAARESNMIYHLCESKFTEILIPVLKSSHAASTYLSGIIEKKSQFVHSMEALLQQGLERIICAIVGHVKYLLNHHQKSTDFKPHADPLGHPSVACQHVCSYLNVTIPRLNCLDGKNLISVKRELTIRLYRTLVENIYKFEFTTSGGFQALCDLTEYISAFKSLQTSSGEDLFDVLCKLINLLVIPPSNLDDICEEEPLNSLSREVKVAFIQLRADHRTHEIKVMLEKI